MKTMFKTLIASAAAFLFVSAQMGEVRAAGSDDISACDGHKGEKSAEKSGEKGKGCDKCGESCKGCDKCGTSECTCDEGCGCGKKSK